MHIEKAPWQISERQSSKWEVAGSNPTVGNNLL